MFSKEAMELLEDVKGLIVEREEMEQERDLYKKALESASNRLEDCPEFLRIGSWADGYDDDYEQRYSGCLNPNGARECTRWDSLNECSSQCWQEYLIQEAKEKDE